VIHFCASKIGKDFGSSINVVIVLEGGGVKIFVTTIQRIKQYVTMGEKLSKNNPFCVTSFMNNSFKEITSILYYQKSLLTCEGEDAIDVQNMHPYIFGQRDVNPFSESFTFFFFFSN
jgi:hypothetical protein